MLIHCHGSTRPVVQRFTCHLPSIGLISSRTFLLSSSSDMGVLIATVHRLVTPSSQITSTCLTVCGGGARRRYVRTLTNRGPRRVLPRTCVQHARRLGGVPLCRLRRRLCHVFRLGRVRSRSTCLFSCLSCMDTCLRSGPSSVRSFLGC